MVRGKRLGVRGAGAGVRGKGQGQALGLQKHLILELFGALLHVFLGLGSVRSGLVQLDERAVLLVVLGLRPRAAYSWLDAVAAVSGVLVRCGGCGRRKMRGS